MYWKGFRQNVITKMRTHHLNDVVYFCNPSASIARTSHTASKNKTIRRHYRWLHTRTRSCMHRAKHYAWGYSKSISRAVLFPERCAQHMYVCVCVCNILMLSCICIARAIWYRAPRLTYMSIFRTDRQAQHARGACVGCIWFNPTFHPLWVKKYC